MILALEGNLVIKENLVQKEQREILALKDNREIKEVVA